MKYINDKNTAIFFVLILTSITQIGCYKENNTQLLDNTFFETEIDSIYYYEFVSENSKELLYKEDFDGANMDWWTGTDGDLKAKFQFGNYNLNNNDDSKLRWLSSLLFLDPSANFEIEAMVRISFSSDDDGGGMGLKDANGNLLNFILDVHNNVGVNQWDNASSKFTRTLDWEEKYWIDSFHGTLLTIRKIDNRYIFFADKKYIGLNLDASELQPDRIVFFLKGDVDMDVDYLSYSRFH